MPAGPGGLAVLREARLGALLQHPNVVGTLQVGEHGGIWCIALELVRGPSVRQLCRQAGGALPPGVVVEVGLQAAAGLEHVHGFRLDDRHTGLVHRDVKPSNLLVDQSGLVKLADLGVSLLSGESDQVAGTRGYMAPEQILGCPEPRSDLFSLGVVLYVMATGQPPLGRGARVAAATRQVESLLQKPAFLAPVDARVPGLGDLVRWCLRHDPALRPGSARELGAALSVLRSRLPRRPTLLETLHQVSPELAPTLAPSSDVPTQRHQAGNLRPPRDAFVGREAELRELATRVREEPWVVLLGPGGAGKTRLALEVARQVVHALPGGAWALDLSLATTEDGVCGAVAAGLELELERADPVGQIGRVFHAMGRTLVVLDNLEQCVAALHQTLPRWLDLAPQVCFLGTSRVVPGLKGEQTLALGELGTDDAVALFRKRAPRPLTRAEETEVEPLCNALERMALPIELAAARLRVLDAEKIRTRLSLALLSGGGLERPERHRSLTASLQWSHDLLSPAGRAALADLSAFEGGFDLAAAEGVIDLERGDTGPFAALDALVELSEASLLRVNPVISRFSLQGVVQQFARPLLSSAEREAAEARHGAHYAQLGAPEAIEALDGRNGIDRYRALERELDNLLAACARAVARGAGAIAVQTLGAAGQILSRRGPRSVWIALARTVVQMPSLSTIDGARAALSLGTALRGAGLVTEALPWLERALGPHLEGTDRHGATRVMEELARAARYAGRLAEARERAERCLLLARELGDRHAEGRVLLILGAVYSDEGNVHAGEVQFEQALLIHRETGNRRAEGMVLGSLGGGLANRARYAEARACFEQALLIDRESGFVGAEASALGNLADLELAEGHPERARDCLERARSLQRQVGHQAEEGATLLNLANLHWYQGRAEEARALLAEALAIHRRAGNRRYEAVAIANLGLYVPEGGDTQASLAPLEQALAIAREVGARKIEGAIVLEIGALHRRERRLAVARVHFHAALTVFREVSDALGEAKALLGLAQVAGDTPAERTAAFDLLRLAESLLDAVGARVERALVLACRAELQARDGDADSARDSLSQATGLADWHVEVRREFGRVRALLGGPDEDAQARAR